LFLRNALQKRGSRKIRTIGEMEFITGGSFHLAAMAGYGSLASVCAEWIGKNNSQDAEVWG